MTRAPRARSFGEVFARVPWCRRPAAGDTRGHRLTAHSPPTKHGIPIIIALAVAAASGCSNEERATDFAREYVRAAAQGNVKRLCAIRTDAALRGWGGQAACGRRANGLAVDPPPPGVGPGLRRGLNRKALAVKPRTANVVPGDTSITGKLPASASPFSPISRWFVRLATRACPGGSVRSQPRAPLPAAAKPLLT